MANPFGPNPVNRRSEVIYQKGDTVKRALPVQYIGGLFKGTMSIIDEPGEKELGVYSELVYQNVPYTKAGELLAKGEPGNPVPMKVAIPLLLNMFFTLSRRTAPMTRCWGCKRRNGDSSLVLFGKRITPNLHSLVNEFVLLDNFIVTQRSAPMDITGVWAVMRRIT